MGLISTKDYGIKAVTALIYGESGIGKTRLALTADNPIIISHESGLLSIREAALPAWEILSSDELGEAEDYVLLSAKGKTYDTIIIDSLTDIASVLLLEYKELFKDPRQAYGLMNDDISKFIRKFRDSGRNVIFTAHEKIVEDEASERITAVPNMPGKTLLTSLPYYFDEVFVYRQVGQKKFLQTNKDGKYIAKDRSGSLAKQEVPNIRSIMNKIKGGTKNPVKQKQPEPNKHKVQSK